MSLVSSPPAQDQLSSRAPLLSILSTIGRNPLILSGDFKAASEWLAQQLYETLDLDGCGIWLLKKNATELQPAVCLGDVVPPVEIPQGEQAMDDLWLDVSVLDRSSVIGVVRCARKHTEDHEWEADFVKAVAGWIGAAFSSARQLKQLDGLENQLVLAADAWEESQHFLQSVLEFSSCILYVNDFDSGCNQYLNSYGKKVLGYSKQAIQQLGKNFLEKLTHPKDRPLLAAAREKLLHEGRGALIESEYRVRHHSGGWRWLLCRETVFQRDDSGKPVQIFGTATDITTRKRQEKQLKGLNRKLQRLANLDGLTQVANRRAFDTRLASHWSAQSNGAIALILCDIDYFKNYNDHYGHQAGDECLRLIAQTLRRAVQQQVEQHIGTVARYGGEEFAIVLLATPLAEAVRMAESILSAVEGLHIAHQVSPISGQVTLSIGVTAADSMVNISPQQLIEAADRGLYRAKYNGRACYCIEVVA